MIIVLVLSALATTIAGCTSEGLFRSNRSIEPSIVVNDVLVPVMVEVTREVVVPVEIEVTREVIVPIKVEVTREVMVPVEIEVTREVSSAVEIEVTRVVSVTEVVVQEVYWAPICPSELNALRAPKECVPQTPFPTWPADKPLVPAFTPTPPAK